MKILALVPARGGSKRLPGKNSMQLGALPLIAWTLRAAKQSNCCCDVLVSTDNAGIANVARAHGASVPWLRPAELATDTATSVDVALHALDWHESRHGALDGMLLLQPTSPFRSAETIRRAVDLFRAHETRRPVVSVARAATHPAWCLRIRDGALSPFVDWPGHARSQELEPAWALNGAIYLIAPQRLRDERAFLTRDTLPLLMEDPRESVDIDTRADFELCSYWVRTTAAAPGSATAAQH